MSNAIIFIDTSCKFWLCCIFKKYFLDFKRKSLRVRLITIIGKFGLKRALD